MTDIQPSTPTSSSPSNSAAKLFGWLPSLFRLGPRPSRVHVVELTGAIMASAGGGGLLNNSPVLNIDALDQGLFHAFKPALARPGALAAVALSINCPGGSPAQSSLIAARIRDLAQRSKTPVLAYVQDVAASGGYWLACAADEIMVDHSSIVGSIGVVSAGFGFVDTLEKLGVERRLHTVGANKVRLDSFQPEKAEDVDWLLALQSQLHRTFKDYVIERRGDKLGVDAEDFDEDAIMNGEVWLGQQAVDRGLADAVTHMHSDLRARFGDKVRLKRFGRQKRGLLGALPFLNSLSIADGLARAIEARALWARFGL